MVAPSLCIIFWHGTWTLDTSSGRGSSNPRSSATPPLGEGACPPRTFSVQAMKKVNQENLREIAECWLGGGRSTAGNRTRSQVSCRLVLCSKPSTQPWQIMNFLLSSLIPVPWSRYIHMGLLSSVYCTAVVCAPEAQEFWKLPGSGNCHIQGIVIPEPATLARILTSHMDVLLPGAQEAAVTVTSGVCFRMYTEDEAKKQGVVGWVKNTSKGTVTGQLQGPEEKVDSIQREAEAEGEAGSPWSREPDAGLDPGTLGS
ncbi:acylphosphatase-2 isoform X4 [Ursus arctos]|uniref:acylphosphatase-2 isoform X4 n=1 Tax=Ursus arctos TaxID=9644 RepID=UPI0025478FB9|nr:acylphosphatase-2 isoform X4 [Ursus arctos]